MNKNILKFCLEKGILLDTETGEMFNDLEEDTAKRIVEKISNLNERFITKTVLDKNADKIKDLIGDKEILKKMKINLNLSLEISEELEVKNKKGFENRSERESNSINKEEEVNLGNEQAAEERETDEESVDEVTNNLGNLRVLQLVPKISRKIETKHFINHHRNRFSVIKRVLRNRNELSSLTSIDKLASKRNGCSVICSVYSKRKTKNDNILLEVEDLTGKVRVLFNKDKEDLYKKAENILPDDIIGIRGYGDNEIIFANDLVYPEATLGEKKSLDSDSRVAFIADIHIGSTHMLEKNFEKFIKWINGEVGNEEQKKIAKEIDYLLINGDSVDGVGIFPEQDELLNIDDIYKQYEKVASHLKKIRKDVKIIIIPGNHDAVWLGQPQPPISEEYAKPLYDLDNVLMASNPCMIEIFENDKTFKILQFHGSSMNDMISNMGSLKMGDAHSTPSIVVKELLRRRHLGPIHGDVDYIPHEKDHLIISEIPDVITTADFHKPQIDEFNNIMIVCNSCWQRQTPFEEKVGNQPDPCKVPVLNLKDRNMKIIDFSDEESHKTYSEVKNEN